MASNPNLRTLGWERERERKKKKKEREKVCGGTAEQPNQQSTTNQYPQHKLQCCLHIQWFIERSSDNGLLKDHLNLMLENHLPLVIRLGCATKFSMQIAGCLSAEGCPYSDRLPSAPPSFPVILIYYWLYILRCSSSVVLTA